MSFVRIWVHVVFSTKDHFPYLETQFRRDVIDHIRKNARIKDVFLDSIGGWTEHLHLLISLGRTQDIAKVLMLIKGESAHWINQQGWFRGKFVWQDDYYAVSVSESQLERVRSYIRNQEKHHATKPFEDELRQLRKLMDKNSE